MPPLPDKKPSEYLYVVSGWERLWFGVQELEVRTSRLTIVIDISH